VLVVELVSLLATLATLSLPLPLPPPPQAANKTLTAQVATNFFIIALVVVVNAIKLHCLLGLFH
jgi:hypothetical protein